jgi:hypothetical protein
VGKYVIDREQDKLDYSTIDVERLRTLPTLLSLIHYSVQVSGHPGAACAGDAPGFPSYFLRSVYGAGQSGPEYVITDPYNTNTHYVVDSLMDHDAQNRRLKELWKPLHIGHERVRLWMQQQYIHFQRCYRDHDKPEYGRPGTLIWPITSFDLISVANVSEDVRERDKDYDPSKTVEQIIWWRQAAVKRQHDAYIESKRHLAVPDNHLAVLSIREFYPEHMPILEWIKKPPMDGYEANNRWWEAYAHPI